MKLLLTSDLHGRRDQYRWILEHACEFDLVCIVGDLLDAFDERGTSKQIQEVIQFVDEMKRLSVPLALCSGNHDAEDIHPHACAYSTATANWLETVAGESVAIDGQSRLFGPVGDRLLVTCLPYDYGHLDSQSLDEMWAEGFSHHRMLNVPWLVLHHEPPMNSLIGGDYGSLWLSERVAMQPCRYLACGHMHSRPYEADGHWADRIDSTWCFNPGRPEASPIGMAPNYVVLDTSTRIASWNFWDESTAQFQTQTLQLNE
ncbi:MAG: hypothetical protein B9S32_03740 [Verrucomicrobia bacterium Tous-C9LFEB]|nr:MAG: hypothetical protein B9S32_03740 [Verrucomicrobia bacterium Tous-C9LFEB]